MSTVGLCALSGESLNYMDNLTLSRPTHGMHVQVLFTYNIVPLHVQKYVCFWCVAGLFLAE